MNPPTRAHFPALRSDRVVVVTPTGTHTVYAATVARLLPAAEAVYAILFNLPEQSYHAIPIELRRAIVELSAVARGESR